MICNNKCISIKTAVKQDDQMMGVAAGNSRPTRRRRCNKRRAPANRHKTNAVCRIISIPGEERFYGRNRGEGASADGIHS